MAVNRLLNIRPQYEDSAGNPASGYRLFFYQAGSTTKLSTYNSSTGLSANTNPITLNSRGEPSVEIWGTVGQSYKIVLANPGSDDPPSSSIWTEDNVSTPDPATGSGSVTEWITGTTPSFVSATQFTVTGDQRTTYHVGRRIKATVTAGTAYGRVSVVSFAASTTTVTVINDSTALDSGLSLVEYGFVSALNTSAPVLNDSQFRILNVTDPLKAVAFNAAPLTTSTTRTVTVANTDFAIGPTFDTPNLTLTHTQLTTPNRWQFNIRDHSGSAASSSAPIYLKFRNVTLGTGSYTSAPITADTAFVLGNGSTFGTSSGVAFRLYLVAVYDGTTVQLGVYNPLSVSGGVTSHVPLDESAVYTTVAGNNVSTADSAQTLYTTNVVTSKAIRILGFFEGTQATAGDWATAISKVQPITPSTPRSGEIVQVTYKADGSYLSNGGVGVAIPYDDTIPQSIEGWQVLSQAITPRNAANIVDVTSTVFVTTNASDDITYALFNGAASALVAGARNTAANEANEMIIRYIAVVNTASSVTWSTRIGCNTPTVVYVNGTTAARRYGGISGTWMEVKEIFV